MLAFHISLQISRFCRFSSVFLQIFAEIGLQSVLPATTAMVKFSAHYARVFRHQYYALLAPHYRLSTSRQSFRSILCRQGLYTAFRFSPSLMLTCSLTFSSFSNCRHIAFADWPAFRISRRSVRLLHNAFQSIDISRSLGCQGVTSPFLLRLLKFRVSAARPYSRRPLRYSAHASRRAAACLLRFGRLSERYLKGSALFLKPVAIAQLGW